jgi:type I restriction enzyme S subunit
VLKGNSRRSVKLGDLFTIKHGYAFKGEHFGSEGSHVVLTPGNFFDEGGFKRKDDKEKWYSGKIPEEYILSQGDLLVAMTEQGEGLLGSAALVPENGRYLHNQRLGLIQNLNGVERHFLYFLFNSHPVRQRIRASCSGVKVRHTSPSRIYEVKVDIPPLPTQRKIAAILSAYDDLIENNLRRIKILEEMAQNLYHEWFVKFRFPGHQHVRFTDSPLGRIPEGWEVLPIKNLGGKVVLGGTPSRNNPLYWGNGTIPWLKSGKLNDLRVMEGTEFITDAGLRESATKMMPPKTVLIAITGAILISFLEVDACANQSVAGIFSVKKCSPEYLHLYLRENISLLESKMSGSAQQHVNKSIVENIIILIPSARLSSLFAQFVEPQYETVANLLRRNTVLRRTRDLLLPRLISGEVDVSELDIAVPEEASA